jgi:hypothetical protein
MSEFKNELSTVDEVHFIRDIFALVVRGVQDDPVEGKRCERATSQVLQYIGTSSYFIPCPHRRGVPIHRRVAPASTVHYSFTLKYLSFRRKKQSLPTCIVYRSMMVGGGGADHILLDMCIAVSVAHIAYMHICK